ncbi:MAG TPA: SAM-dependent methyltransferase [Cellulomonadaceae bacterium]|nr:SAM-dependent methyltransferase [Cellulomonadaceae bacterium]
MSSALPLPRAVTGTAPWIAAARARESARSDALFTDPWAADLAGKEGRDRLAASERASGQENPFLPVRTRFFDDLLTAATWAEQIVLLGAGMDTRAYRLDLHADTVVFELDAPEVFAAKRIVLDAVAPRCQRREVHADLAGEWEPALRDAGFDPARGTVWLAEGLLFYLTEAAVGRVLGTSAQACRARALFAADIFGTGLLTLPGMQPLVEHRRSSNTALPFCTDQPRELLSAHRWRTDDLIRLGQPEANFGRLPTVAPDADRAHDPTMRTYLAIGVRND